jgi:hypothetical protein
MAGMRDVPFRHTATAINRKRNGSNVFGIVFADYPLPSAPPLPCHFHRLFSSRSGFWLLRESHRTSRKPPRYFHHPQPSREVRIAKRGPCTGYGPHFSTCPRALAVSGQFIRAGCAGCSASYRGRSGVLRPLARPTPGWENFRSGGGRGSLAHSLRCRPRSRDDPDPRRSPRG